MDARFVARPEQVLPGRWRPLGLHWGTHGSFDKLLHPRLLHPWLAGGGEHLAARLFRYWRRRLGRRRGPLLLLQASWLSPCGCRLHLLRRRRLELRAGPWAGAWPWGQPGRLRWLRRLLVLLDWLLRRQRLRLMLRLRHLRDAR